MRSRSTWACELKSAPRFGGYQNGSHAPRERVSWNMLSRAKPLPLSASRSTWACELKLFQFGIGICGTCHAPRERVSWNFGKLVKPRKFAVTLHVSVWVEIILPYVILPADESRSTWACESIFVSTQDLVYVIRSDHSKCCAWCSKLAVKDVYPEFNWRKGGYVHGRRKWYSHKVKKRRKSWVPCLP